MRSSKSRSRNKSNRNRSVGNIVNRVFDSSGPEGKVRGTPQQIIEKYNQLARDAQLSNDRVAAENFQQHAEHYLRMLAEAQREQQERQERQERQNQQNQSRRDQNEGGDRGQDAGEREQPAEAQEGRKREAPASDVIDVSRDEEAGGLVETPEDQPKKPRRSRRKPTDATGETPQDAAE